MAEKKEITATIDIDELLYDIMNETYLRGRTIQNDENYKAVASMFASLDDENQDKILRSIKRAFSEVKSALSECLNENALTTDNKLINTTDDLVISLAMPTNFAESATVGVGEAIHDYLRNTAVADWYLVTNKADAADYLSLANNSLESIKRSVSKRSRPTRRNI